MRCALLALLALTGCSAAPAQTPPAADAHLIIRIADITDCGGSGTTCPELTSPRRIRVGLDGAVEPYPGTPDRVAPGPGPHPFGVRLRPGHADVRTPAGPFTVALRGFGGQPRLSWSPSGRRFSILKDFDTLHVNRLVIADPGQRRWWQMPMRGRDVWALAWLDDDHLVAQIADRDGYVHLVTLDPVSGRVLRSRALNDPYREIAWSPAARRLAFQDATDNRVGVVTLTHPADVTWTSLKGVPTWSPDGTRMLVTGSRTTLAAWPAGATIRLPREFSNGLWLSEGHALLGLLGTLNQFAQAPAKLVQIGDDGQVKREIPVRWPSRVDPDDSFSLGPLAIPTMIEGLDP